MSTFSPIRRMIIVLAVFLLTGCATLPPPPIASTSGNGGLARGTSIDPDALLGVEWLLAEIRPTGGEILKSNDPSKYSLEFATDGGFSGQLDCNRLRGSYTLDSGQIVFGPIASTMAFCPEDDLFAPYMAALNSVRTWEVAGENLVVTYDGGELVFAPAGHEGMAASVVAEPGIVGMEWQLQTIQMMNDETFAPGETDLYSLMLDDDGTASGEADCNRFGGTYTLDGAQLTFGPMNATRAMCAETSLSDRYLANLADVHSFVLSEGHLFLSFGPDAGILEFAPAPMLLNVDGVTAAALMNGTYVGVYDEAIALIDGRFEGKPFVADGASRPTVTLRPEMTALGDLNGDGNDDGVAILAENSGGSGTFIYLAALVDEDGAAVNVATILLGDRVRVESVVIEDGTIVLVAGTFADNDPLCCPSQRTRFTFALDGTELVELSAESL